MLKIRIDAQVMADMLQATAAILEKEMESGDVKTRRIEHEFLKFHLASDILKSDIRESGTTYALAVVLEPKINYDWLVQQIIWYTVQLRQTALAIENGLSYSTNDIMRCVNALQDIANSLKFAPADPLI